MLFLFLTSNQNKIKETRAILGSDITIAGKTVELDEIQAVKLEKVIKHKIIEAKKILPNKKFFVEDTALYLGKNKEIGALVKFLDNKRIVKAYKGESAEAVCAIGLSNGKIFKGVIKGKIVPEKGQQGFGWDPIFQPKGFSQTFAQMSFGQKNQLSMRKRALGKMKRYLLTRGGGCRAG